MWRDKEKDLKEISRFIDHLKAFLLLKQTKWEAIDEKVQRENPPATPGEDWDMPLDENEVGHELEKDPEYASLKRGIQQSVPKLKEIAAFLHFNVHHDFDWINFNSPLIGNDALEDGIEMAEKLKKACDRHNYPFQNMVCLFKTQRK